MIICTHNRRNHRVLVMLQSWKGTTGKVERRDGKGKRTHDLIESVFEIGSLTRLVRLSEESIRVLCEELGRLVGLMVARAVLGRRVGVDKVSAGLKRRWKRATDVSRISLEKREKGEEREKDK
jgi:hypothetical protein